MLPEPRTWGGRRKGAGRKPRDPKRRCVAHRARPAHVGAHPVHLTMRVAKGLPSFRRKDLFAVVRDALVATRGDFRVLEFSVQENHLHLIVEAGTRRSLMAGAKGLAVRIAQVINKALGRSGQCGATATTPTRC